MSKTTLLTLADWDVFVLELLPSLKPGTIIALSGPLGAGKTTFVQALARALGISSIPMSPTFSLVRTYPVKQHQSIKKLIHVDAYRLDNEKDVTTLGLDELLAEEGSLMCLEWPEQVESWLKNQVKVIRMTIRPEPDGRIVSL